MYPKDALLFRIKETAFLWGGEVVEAFGYRHDDEDGIVDIQFRFPDTGYEDGYSTTQLDPLTPAARDFMEAAVTRE